MSDLIEFLRARLAEDEAAAKAASPAPWYPKTTDDLSIGEFGWSFGSTAYGSRGGFDCLAAEASDSEQGKADALHVARWDPERVLAEVEDWRHVLEAWEMIGKEAGLSASFSWVAVRDMVIRPKLARHAGHPDFDSAWLA